MRKTIYRLNRIFRILSLVRSYKKETCLLIRYLGKLISFLLFKKEDNNPIAYFILEEELLEKIQKYIYYFVK